MSEHSPTPWFVHDFADPAVSSDPSPADVTISCDHPATITVASMDRAMTATLEEARANAAFIVRAVNAHDEMVEALKLADDMLSRSEFVQSINHAKIRSALSRASQTTGGENE